MTQIRRFLKERCRCPDDSKLMKQALEKVDENCKFIESKRKSVNFKFSDTAAVVSYIAS